MHLTFIFITKESCDDLEMAAKTRVPRVPGDLNLVM